MTEPRGKSETAKREEEILAFWKENKTFERSLDKKAPKGEFVFYDGPPFATGLPHHGSLLSSIIKDVIPRYKTMQGYTVRRRWGWDTHGLPIENLVEKELGLKTKKEILEIGIAKFNESARSMVLKYVHDWQRYIDRVGRWVDYENSYKTMDNTYIGSVWWALKQLDTKGLLYEGNKVLMYCTHCETPLAKAEIAADNTYKDITEEAITVKFELKDESKTYFLAWTTTPWTLPGNVALAVGADIEYVKAKAGEVTYVLAKERAATVLKDIVHEVVGTVKGSELVGKAYAPVFDVPSLKIEKSHKVQVADFVTTEDGTGIVHIAPMYGEDDNQLGHREKLPMVQLLNPNGTYNDQAPESLRGIYLRDANKDIKRTLDERGLLFARANHTHSYPHCWRCGTPLIYNAVSSWFINIQKIKAKMIAENQNINWVPEHLKNGRFGKILETAPDWTISRNRFWASPLPIWKSKEGKVMVIGSLAELKEKSKKSGNAYFLMRHGEADTNVTNTLSSKKDAPMHLTKKGEEDVRDSAKNLGKKIDLIIASPFVRTRESAEIAAEALGLSKSDIVFDDRLGEYDLGKRDGISLEEWHLEYPAEVDRFEHGPEGGENDAQVRRRMGQVLWELEEKHAGKNILIVSHGTPLWLLKGAVKGLTKAEIVATYKTEYPSKGKITELPFAPIPVNADFELDLHRPYTDSITLLDESGTEYQRIPEVIDCWVESGSMPFAEYHYPFENRAEFESRAPGDFIAEYIAQTRTWFYYLHAMSIALFDRVAFKNVVTTGTIVAADGEKISKSKKNYTDPLELIDQYGADAMRLYLLGSPVMQAEDLRFRDEDVRDAHNRIIGILWNSFKFFDLYQKEYDGSVQGRKSEHVLDRWIFALLDETSEEVTVAMEAYDTPRAVRAIRGFVDEYSTWYVRRSRDRVKSEWHDRQSALATQREVLQTFSKLIAPMMPFLAEGIWRGIDGGGSVHLEAWPQVKRGFFARLFPKNTSVLAEMKEVRAIVTKALEARDKAGIKVRQPLNLLEIGSDVSKELRDIIREEVNVKQVMPVKGLAAGEVRLDTVITPELRHEGEVRELLRAVQGLRKEGGLNPGEETTLLVSAADEARVVIESAKGDLERVASVKGVVFTDNVEGSSVKLGGGSANLRLG
jgi:isoleucyl-tRNA synthetase